MPKDKVKEIVGEYWKAFVEGIVTSAIIPAFMSINRILFAVGLMFIITDVIILIHSVVELEDPKFLFVFFVTEYLMKDK